MYTKNIDDGDKQYFGVFEVTYRITGERGSGGDTYTTRMLRQPDMSRPNEQYLKANAHQVAAADARHEANARVNRQEEVDVVDIERHDGKSERFFENLD